MIKEAPRTESRSSRGFDTQRSSSSKASRVDSKTSLRQLARSSRSEAKSSNPDRGANASSNSSYKDAAARARVWGEPKSTTRKAVDAVANGAKSVADKVTQPARDAYTLGRDAVRKATGETRYFSHQMESRYAKQRLAENGKEVVVRGAGIGANAVVPGTGSFVEKGLRYAMGDDLNTQGDASTTEAIAEEAAATAGADILSTGAAQVTSTAVETITGSKIAGNIASKAVSMVTGDAADSAISRLLDADQVSDEQRNKAHLN